jgi:O-antigen ligase
MVRMATDLIYGAPAPLSSTRRRRRNRLIWWLAYAAVVVAGLAVAAVAYGRSYQPYFGVAWGCFVFLLALWLWFPRLALGATLALTLTGDLATVAWFPFDKNLSSWESIMFLSDGVPLRPIEISVIWGLIVTLYRHFQTTGRLLRRTPLLLPFVAFASFTLLGLLRGLSTGGDRRAAIYEVRALILLPLLYVLIVHVCSSRRDYRRLMWVAAGAMTLHSVLSLDFLFRLPAATRQELESLYEHGAAVGANLVFMMLFTALAYRGVSWRIRIALFVASVPLLWAYLVAERRSAIVALVGAVVLWGVMIYWRQRRTFWKVVPVVTIILIGYSGAFWNSQSTAGFPAQAIKTVIAADQRTEKDESSNLYRELETLNLAETVRASPVFGIGFGQPFLRPYPLPDISFFEFHAFIPHNSFIWIWTKMGFGGFVTLLYIIAQTMLHGTRRARAAPPGVDAVVALAGVLFVAMYTVFLYVDIAWGSRGVFLLALGMGICTGPLDDDSPPDEVTRPDLEVTDSRRSHAQLSGDLVPMSPRP